MLLWKVFACCMLIATPLRAQSSVSDSSISDEDKQIIVQMNMLRQLDFLKNNEPLMDEKDEDDRDK